MAVLLIVGSNAALAAPKDKGEHQANEHAAQGREHGNSQAQGQGREHAPGQSQAEARAAERAEQRVTASSSAASSASQQSDQLRAIERRSSIDAKDADVRAPQERHSHGWANGRESRDGHVQLASLRQSLRVLEHARWSHNPHDVRGQGNMGRVDMRDPYGFDKDSGREGAERGRAIHPAEEPPPPAEEPPPPAEEPPPLPEPIIADLMTISFDIADPYYAVLQTSLAYYQQLAASDPSNATYATIVATLASTLTDYESTIRTSDPVAVNMDGGTLSYTLSFAGTQVFAGTTLQITTQLTSVGNYTSGDYVWDPNTFEVVLKQIDYTAGEVVVEQTQTVMLGDATSVSYSYDPPVELVGSEGNAFLLTVTVTDPTTGTSYTLTDDRQVYLYRCPYGVVYDRKTGQPVPGATVTVHFADGAIVPLEKASNPDATNPQLTDATGRYNCKLVIGKKYYLTVEAPGYEAYRSGHFSENWQIVREDVALSPAPALALK